MVPGLPSGEGWAESEEWIPRARRLGPLRYSDLGRRVLDPVPPAAVGGLGGWMAAQADRWWEAAGYPDPFALVVVSGDDGPLAAAVLQSGPKCAAALRYVVVNPDASGRTEPPARLVQLVALEDPVFLFPSRRRDGADLDEWDDIDDGDDPAETPPARGIGPLATFLTDVPALGEVVGAVVAVGLLSRLPYDLYEYGDGGWAELRVSVDGGGGGDGYGGELREMALPVADETSGLPETPAGAGRWARQTGAADWLRRVVPGAKAAHLAVVDDWDRPAGVDLDQLRPVREPLDAEPVPVEGTPFSVVTWRL